MDSTYSEAFNEQPQAYQFYQAGYRSQMTGELEDAVDFYQKSLESYPTAQAYTFLGWTYSFMGQFGQAIKECKNAIFIDPDFGNPYNDIGCYLLHFGKTDEAVDWFKKSLAAKKYESYYFPNLNLGRVYTAKGDFDQALKYFRLAIKENPRDDQAHSLIQEIKDYLDRVDHPDPNTDKE